MMGNKYDNKYIVECIGYLCKYYLVDRTFNKRMQIEHRKMTSYNFK